MKSRSTYSPEVTRRARRVLADVFAALGPWGDYAVLIGGGAPGLLHQMLLESAPGHAGTTDADILLDPSGFTVDDYETLARWPVSGSRSRCRRSRLRDIKGVGIQ